MTALTGGALEERGLLPPWRLVGVNRFLGLSGPRPCLNRSALVVLVGAAATKTRKRAKRVKRDLKVPNMMDSLEGKDCRERMDCSE